MLGIVGVYGVIAYATDQRAREVGIRLALGATPAGLKRLVVTEGLRPVLSGVFAGMSAAVSARWGVRGLLYEVAAVDQVTLAAVPTVLLAAALLACYLPARRAARIDPATTLREG